MSHSSRWHIDDGLAMPFDHQSSGVGHLTDDVGSDFPLAADCQEIVDLLGRHDGAHALLRLTHENLFGSQSGIAQRNRIQADVHAAFTITGQFTCGT